MDMVIFEDIDIEIDQAILKNIDIDIDKVYWNTLRGIARAP